MKGQFLIEVLKNNEVVKKLVCNNMILQPGVRWYLRYARPNSTSYFGYIPIGRVELGSSSTLANINQTQLVNKNNSWVKEAGGVITPLVSGAYPNPILISYSNLFHFNTGDIVGTVREIGVKITNSQLSNMKSIYPELNTTGIDNVPLFARMVLNNDLELQADEQLRLTYTVTTENSSIGTNATININNVNYQCTIYKYSLGSYSNNNMFPTISGGISEFKVLSLIRVPFTRNIIGQISKFDISRSIATQVFVNENTLKYDISIPAATVISGNIYGFSLRMGQYQSDDEFIVVNLNGQFFTKSNTEILNISLQWSVSAI